MKVTSAFFFFFTALLLVFVTPYSYSQQEQQLDSLKYKLAQFEKHKKELGAHATKMMDTTKVDIINNMVKVYTLTHPSDGLPLALQALALSEKINYSEGSAIATNMLGMIYNYKSDYVKALDYYNRSLKIGKETNNLKGQIDTYINIGVLYSRQSNNVKALDNLIKGLEIAKKNNDSYGIFAAYNNMGTVYTNQNKLNDALKNYKNCLKIQLKYKDDYYTAITYQNIGDTYISLNKPEAALNYFQSGLKMAIASHNKESASNNYNGIGKVFEEKKDYGNALKNYTTALAMREEIEDVLGIAYSYITIGNVYFKKGDNGKALLNVKKGISLAEKSGEPVLLKEGYYNLSNIYSAEGDYKQAYINYKLYKEANDKVFNSETENKLTEMQLKYEFKNVQDSLKTIQDKKDIMVREKSHIQERTRNYIYTGLGMLVIFLIVLLFQGNKIALIKKEKAIEEERNRISRNLHDDLGTQLSAIRMFVSSIKNQTEEEHITTTVENSINLLDASIHDLRNIMNEIQSSVLLEKGYLVATEELVNKINQLHLIKFTLSHHKIDRRFSTRIEHEMYRITQELVNNTLKYAKAKNVTIDLLKRDGKLIMMYEDDGVGYDMQTVVRGNGLDNIETRVRSIDATVEFDATPGAGSRTIIEIPL